MMRILSLPRPLLSLYLLFCVLASSWTLSSFARMPLSHLPLRQSFGTEWVMVTGQVLFQWLFMSPTNWTSKKNYMIIALSVSMIGSLLLLPFLLVHTLYTTSTASAICYFFVVVAIIFLIHHQLIKKLVLPKILSLTWVIYRFILLIYILTPEWA